MHVKDFTRLFLDEYVMYVCMYVMIRLLLCPYIEIFEKHTILYIMPLCITRIRVGQYE